MSEPLKEDDPSYWMLQRGIDESNGSIPNTGWVSKAEVYSERCYICRDPEFALMGLPLCLPCPRCQESGSLGHVPADDVMCTVCGYNVYEQYMEDGLDD